MPWATNPLADVSKAKFPQETPSVIPVRYGILSVIVNILFGATTARRAAFLALILLAPATKPKSLFQCGEFLLAHANLHGELL